MDYAVITSVDRDDLIDGGASIFTKTVYEIKQKSKAKIELLIPDFNNDRFSIDKVAKSSPDIIGHNIETVKRLTPALRDKKASYGKSLKVLNSIKEIDPNIKTKSAIMLGHGESKKEVQETLIDLKNSQVDIIVIGQYLRPTAKQVEVKEYISPEAFNECKEIALNLGFNKVISHPLARSSYQAGIT